MAAANVAKAFASTRGQVAPLAELLAFALRQRSKQIRLWGDRAGSMQLGRTMWDGPQQRKRLP